MHDVEPELHQIERPEGVANFPLLQGMLNHSNLNPHFTQTQRFPQMNEAQKPECPF